MSGFPCIVVHCAVELETSYALTMERIASCRKAACIGHGTLRSGGSAVEAVEAALRWLEDDELFNCGYGSVVQPVQHLGATLEERQAVRLARSARVQMDASIVEGASRRTGSVVGVSQFDHPVSLARRALLSAPNAILNSAKQPELARLARNARLWAAESAAAVAPTELTPLTGALGCVAWDGASVAAGSTSGGAQAGASLLGSALYADSLFGCSLTCHGDEALALGLARRAGDFGALARALDGLLLPAGAVRLLTDGTFLLHHTGARMPFAYVAQDGSVTCAAASRAIAATDSAVCNTIE